MRLWLLVPIFLTLLRNRYQKIVNTKKIGYDTISLRAKRTRFFDLKSNLDKIIIHLLKSLTVDIRDLNWEKGIEKVIKSILA